MRSLKNIEIWNFEDDFINEVYWNFNKSKNNISSRLQFLIFFTSILKKNNFTYALYSDTKKEIVENKNMSKNLVFDEIVIMKKNLDSVLKLIQELNLKVFRDRYGRIIVQNEKRIIKITITYFNIKTSDLKYINKGSENLYFLDNSIKNKLIGKLSLIYLEYLFKKIKKLIANYFYKEKDKSFQLKKIKKYDFVNLNIETKSSVNWFLRKPHLDLVTNGGKNIKVKQIINYFQSTNNLDMTLSKLIITNTSKPFEMPIQINKNFWLEGNNFFILPMMYQFRKNVVPYEEVNSYISKDKKPMLYSKEYYENLPNMNYKEIEEFLRENPIEIVDNTITSGRHRALAMIGRLIEGKKYIPFYAYVK